jgi:predicted membrane protein
VCAEVWNEVDLRLSEQAISPARGKRKYQPVGRKNAGAHMKGIATTSSARIQFCLTAVVCLLAPFFCSARAATRHHNAFYITFEVPNGFGAFPVGINDSLTVTGYYTDATQKTRGFVRYVFGEVATFAVPGSFYTQPVGINNAGEIAGYYEDVAGVVLGFVRSPDGNITTFNPGGSGGSTQPRAINDSGMVVGNYTPSNVARGFAFIRHPDGSIVTFGIRGGSYVIPESINDAGEITGSYYYDRSTRVGGFMRHPDGNITTFDYAEGIIPTAINQAGTIAGWYGGTTSFQGFVRSAKGVITPFEFPGQVDTLYMSINRAGFIAGSYITPSGTTENGFLRSPDGAITTVNPPGSRVTSVVDINDLGVITGVYSGNTGGGVFLRIPEFDWR